MSIEKFGVSGTTFLAAPSPPYVIFCHFFWEQKQKTLSFTFMTLNDQQQVNNCVSQSTHPIPISKFIVFSHFMRNVLSINKVAYRP